jgi:hypothetical protein
MLGKKLKDKGVGGGGVNRTGAGWHGVVDPQLLPPNLDFTIQKGLDLNQISN